jgi:hypothetical protein
MSQRKRQVLLFLLPDDEATIALEVKRALPEVRLVDEWRWEDRMRPPVREYPAECDGEIGLWNSRIEPDLIGVPRANGKIDGPVIGPVVQWTRCRITDGRLNAGRWAAVYDSEDKETAAYVRKLWKIVDSATRTDLRRISGDLSAGSTTERRFRVGSAAYRSALDGKLSLVANQLILAPE